MIDEAGYWWERQEANLTTWEQAKEAILRVYGDRNKQRNSVTKIKNLQQGSRPISAFFTEADTLNIYAQLDPQTLPNFLDPGLNDDLRMHMELMNNIQPLNSYTQWKERTLDLGSKLEANKKRHATPRTGKIVPNRGGNTFNNVTQRPDARRQQSVTRRGVTRRGGASRAEAGLVWTTLSCLLGLT